MRVVTAPFHAHIGRNDVSVFLAGGITNCPDWQNELIGRLTKGVNNNIVFLNPRRPNFDLSSGKMAGEQIEWEYDYLNLAKYRIFWFPAESICPIALFELGKELARRKDGLIVGCAEAYPRRFDLEMQCQLERQSVYLGYHKFVGEVVKCLADF